MSVQLKGFHVVLADNMREDDAKPIIEAIKLIKGVIAVEPVEANSPEDFFSSVRMRDYYWEGIRKLFWGQKE